MIRTARTGERFESMAAQAPRGRGAPVPDTEEQVIEEDEGEKPDAGNAAGDEEKMNRDRLNVNEEHKTPDMEKRHRGTFP